jgi:hypothetical protein
MHLYNSSLVFGLYFARECREYEWILSNLMAVHPLAPSAENRRFARLNYEAGCAIVNWPLRDSQPNLPMLTPTPEPADYSKRRRADLCYMFRLWDAVRA